MNFKSNSNNSLFLGHDVVLLSISTWATPFGQDFAPMTTCTFKLWIRILHHGKPFDSIRRETTSKMKSPNCRHDSSRPNQILRPDFHAIWRVHARTSRRNIFHDARNLTIFIEIDWWLMWSYSSMISGYYDVFASQLNRLDESEPRHDTDF